MHHWQWIVVNEFLPQIVGRSLVDDILRNGRRWYKFSNPTMPVEFQTGAYRFGHSLIRPSYRANLQGDPGGNPATGAPAFFGFIFDPAGEGQVDPVDLRGGARARRRFIGWQTFFDFGGDQTQHVRPNKLIDTNISTPLFRLPLAAIPSRDAPTSLPQRNLLRHLTWSLPSGQRIAASTGSPVFGSRHFPELRQYSIGLDASTPMWYYILRGQRPQQRRAAWPGWWPDRRRDDHRNASARQVLLPQHQVPAVPAEPDPRHVHDDRPAPVGKGGSRQPRPVATP